MAGYRASGVNGREKEASDYVINLDRIGQPLGIPTGARTDQFPAAYNLHDQGQERIYEILLIRFMMNPLINGLLLNAKWGEADPDDYLGQKILNPRQLRTMSLRLVMGFRLLILLKRLHQARRVVRHRSLMAFADVAQLRSKSPALG